jgi:1-acyl-sn-glycerol-3-phosphate acyltransferase
MRVPATTETDLPGRSPRLFRLFRRYVRRYVARYFHAVRVSCTGPMPELPRGPVVVVLNHPSWWDPMIGIVLSGFMPDRREHYAPIEAAGLSQYRFLARLGFFGFDAGTAAGARRFLRTSLAILSRPDSVLWITAEGEFTDVRRRPTVLKPGIGHLAHRVTDATLIPMAIEYPFWNDRCPEALVRFGRPIAIGSGGERSAQGWTSLVEQELQETLDRLAAESLRRDPSLFVTAHAGTAGVGGVYDIGRRIQAWFGGTSFRAEHSIRPAAGDVIRPVPEPDGAEGGRNPSR